MSYAQSVGFGALHSVWRAGSPAEFAAIIEVQRAKIAAIYRATAKPAQ
jgi:hypothetical protein